MHNLQQKTAESTEYREAVEVEFWRKMQREDFIRGGTSLRGDRVYVNKELLAN